MKIKLIEHNTYAGMYWLQWADGVKSADFYNLTWAKEHCLGEAEKESSIASR